MPTSISGTRPATITHGSTTSRRSRSAMATIEPIRRPYLPSDYLADAAPVHASTRRCTWKRSGTRAIRWARCATSRTCAGDRACRAWPWPRPGSTATTLRPCSSSRRHSSSCAASATSRAPMRRPSDAAPGGTTDRDLARGIRPAGAARPALRPADAVVAHGRGGATGGRLPAKRRSSSTTRACLPIAPPRRSRAGARRWPTLAQRPNVAVKISGIGQRGVPWTAEGESRHRAHPHRPVRRRALHVREQLPGRQRVRDVSRRSSTASAQIVADFPLHEQRALFRDNAMRIYDIP